MKFDVFCRKINEASAVGKKVKNLSNSSEMYDPNKPNDKRAFFDKFVADNAAKAKCKADKEKEEKVPEVQEPDENILNNEKLEDKKKDVAEEIADLFKKALDGDTAEILDSVKDSGLIETIKTFIKDVYSAQDGVQPSSRMVALTNIETIADQVSDKLDGIFANDNVENWDTGEGEDEEEDYSGIDYDDSEDDSTDDTEEEEPEEETDDTEDDEESDDTEEE